MKNKDKDPLLEAVALAQAGDKNAFGTIVMLNHDYLRAFIASRCTYPQDTDDLAQDAFVLAYKKIGELNDPKVFRSWLTSIAINLIRNHQRKQQKITLEDQDVLERMLDDSVEQHSEPASNVSLHALKECMLKLSIELQNLMRWHYVDELSVKEMTERLDVKHSTLTMRLHRCRQALKECMSNNQRLNES